MAMLTKCFLVWAAMIMLVSALAMPPNTTSSCPRSRQKRTPLPHDYGVYTPTTLRINKETKESENTYTTQQMKQFQAAHNDALMMCRMVIKEATASPVRFDRIFRQYFPFSDRQVVINVFKSILGPDHQGKGNPKFEDIDIVDNYPSIYEGEDTQCDCGKVAVTGQKSDDRGQGRVQIILCPPFFTYGTFQGGPNREWPGIFTPKCANIAYRVSTKMDTLGSFLLHEYTHIDEFVLPILNERVDVENEVYGYHDTREFALTDTAEAKHNADSYASFAAELTWSKLCNRDFEEPLEGDHLKKRATFVEDAADIKEIDFTEPNTTETAAKETDGTKEADAKEQSPRHDIQSAPSLHKRTAFSQLYQHPIPKTDENTYTVEQMDQYLEAHTDALHICSVIIEQAERNTDRFNRIFGQYFKPDDREVVLDFFKAILDYDGAKQGSPHFSNMYLVDNFVTDHGTGRHWICQRGKSAAAITWEGPTELVLCHVFFMLGAIEGPPEERRKGHVWQVTCDHLGKRVSKRMETMSHVLLHEYTHVRQIMEPILGAGLIELGKTKDHAYGFVESQSLDKDLATRNADSYADFASELFWTTKCDRDFDRQRRRIGNQPIIN